MLLEGEGVPFQSIAEEEGLSPTSVRARVYRLRRLLRREFAGMLTVLLVATGGGALAHEWHARSAPALAGPDWASSASTSLPAWAVGDFEVVDVAPDGSLDAATRTVFAGAARSATVSIHAGRMEVRTPTATVSRRFTAEPDGDSGVRIMLEDAAGSQPVRLSVDARGRLLVESNAGRLRGTAVLRAIAPQR